MAELSTNRNYIPLLVLILAGESIFFLPFVLARVFRPTLLEVFNISNVELGSYFSIYGFVAMFSYFFGGPLADRYSSRNLMATALVLTALGGFVLINSPNSNNLFYLYAFWGFTTIFLFWSALIKATRVWGRDMQGKAFGFLEGGRGLASALIATLAIFIFSWLMPEESSVNYVFEREQSFQTVIVTVSLLTLSSGFLVLFFIPKESKKSQGHFIKLKDLKEVLTNPLIILQGVIIVSAYVGYKITDDISLYAHEVLGYSEVEAAGFGTFSLWMRPVFAIIAGLLIDKYSGSRIIVWCFSSMAIGGLFMSLDLISGVTVLILMSLIATLAGVYGVRSAYFTLVTESKTPISLTGTAVGIISVLGFTPDIFMSPLMGYLLDNNPGETGHRYVFLTLSLFSVVGLMAVLLFRKLIQQIS